MQRMRDRRNIRIMIREILKKLKGLMRNNPYDLTLEQFLKLESKKSKYTNWERL